MSKSLGNVRTVRELLGEYPGEVLRCALLSAQYRSPLNFSGELLDQARGTLDSLYGALRRHGETLAEAIDVQETGVYKALLDDLNTPEAFAHLHAAASTLNKSSDAAEMALAKAELQLGASLLGLLENDPENWFHGDGADSGLPAEDIEIFIAQRIQAKQDKDYARADQIRSDLEVQGILLEDSPEGTTWRRGA